MPFTSYQQFVRRLFKEMPSLIETRLHAAVGISGEAGELIDAVKKTWVYNKPLDNKNVQEELGDLLFYIQAMANTYDLTLNDLMQSNMKKLNRRYPSGSYSDAAAQQRADKTRD